MDLVVLNNCKQIPIIRKNYYRHLTTSVKKVIKTENQQKIFF
jgi:hypothetical protein